MPSFQDSAVIFFIALLLFGPKKLPELARYVGKLMGEFRRASSEFRLQMEDEFRLSEQAEAQKKLAAIEAAAPASPLIEPIPDPEHPHLMAEAGIDETEEAHTAEATPESDTKPLPIASAGEIHMMPPSTGLPVARDPHVAAIGGLFAAIPHVPQEAETEPIHTPEPIPEETHHA